MFCNAVYCAAGAASAAHWYYGCQTFGGTCNWYSLCKVIKMLRRRTPLGSLGAAAPKSAFAYFCLTAKVGRAGARNTPFSFVLFPAQCTEPSYRAFRYDPAPVEPMEVLFASFFFQEKGGREKVGG